MTLLTFKSWYTIELINYYLTSYYRTRNNKVLCFLLTLVEYRSEKQTGRVAAPIRKKLKLTLPTLIILLFWIHHLIISHFAFYY